MDSTDRGGEPPRDELENLRTEFDAMTQRQQRLADLLKCPPDKLEHALRNVLNELRLLRTLFESQEQKK